MADRILTTDLLARLREGMPSLLITPALLAANIGVFVALMASGANFWHSSNGVQLAWGGNFGPATQDGEWWRLLTALFMHFGAPHLALNMWALWDAGQFVERLFGRLRFAVLYALSGLAGNLLSLAVHGDHAISGGASGAIFGVLGALLACLWRRRAEVHPHEFRWLFWGAAGFAAITLVLGMLVSGLDNAAHGGGLIAGMLAGIVLDPDWRADRVSELTSRGLAAAALVAATLGTTASIAPPAYRWSDELVARREIGAFVRDDAAIARTWQDIVDEGRSRPDSNEAIADRIDASIADRYQESFEHLSRVPPNPALPSATAIITLRRYAQTRRDASRSFAAGLRDHDATRIDEARRLEMQAAAIRDSLGARPARQRSGELPMPSEERIARSPAR